MTSESGSQETRFGEIPACAEMTAGIKTQTRSLSCSSIKMANWL
ncbi:MAG: hypothetical protein OXJ52_03810 [Oligoflexia bacterium]|nr:hypothetical protein [Oligoflexia bacterium]